MLFPLFPASRAKLSAVNSISKFRGQAKNALYPQPEGQLGECMIRYGNELGDESEFGTYMVNDNYLSRLTENPQMGLWKLADPICWHTSL